MFKPLAYSGIVTLVTLAVSTPAAAQARSAVTASELETAVTATPAPNQAEVQRFLQDPRVVEAANGLGVRTSDLAARVGRLDEATLSQIATRTRATDPALAGGSTVVITTTVIIIALLILIVLLVA
ncbi:MAG TPA: hypothetical protein VJN95_14765 [Gemmatimonadales bacterium]|nr:hypothetical protein [Gemmatimonadales bacterium]